MHDIVERAYGGDVERIGRRPAPMDDDYDERIRTARVLVADDDGVVGLIVLVGAPDHVLIANVAVHPDHQRAGIGRALLSLAEDYAGEARPRPATAVHECRDGREHTAVHAARVRGRRPSQKTSCVNPFGVWRVERPV